jgi:rhodanese-related sulfurtransferase
VPTVDEMLTAARERLDRLDPEAADDAVARGAVIVDIRPEALRARDGVIPGALHHERNVLEWRADPASDHRDPQIADPGRQVIVMCDEGYTSSLAAAVLQDLGLAQATDMVGGYQAWRAAGLPVQRAPDVASELGA